MRILTVCQPWAWATVHKDKRIENRRWGTDYRGVVLIHAGKGRMCLGEEEGLFVSPPYEGLVYGAVIGAARLLDCVPIKDGMGKYAFGPYCWQWGNPVALEPIYCRGQQGLRTPAADVMEAVRERLHGNSDFVKTLGLEGL